MHTSDTTMPKTFKVCQDCLSKGIEFADTIVMCDTRETCHTCNMEIETLEYKNIMPLEDIQVPVVFTGHTGIYLWYSARVNIPGRK